MLFRYAAEEAACGTPFDDSTCAWVPASADNINNLQSKYGFNMYDYYKAAYDCNVGADTPGSPDLVNAPDDGSIPTCWYGLAAQYAKVTTSQHGFQGQLLSVNFDLEDF